MATLTAANATIFLNIPDLFASPQQIQGFAADDIFSADSIQSAETLMGVDGNLSGGFVFVPVPWSLTLQADSDSNDFFDQWWTAQQTARDTYTAQGTVYLLPVGRVYTLTKGFLTGYKPMPDAKKLLQPRTFGLTWQSIVPQPV